VPARALVPFVVVAALVVAPGAAARPAKEAGIRLAAGVGPVALGTPRGVLESELGAGRGGSDWFGATVRYPRQHVLVSYLVRTAFRVGTTWPGYRTAEGVGPVKPGDWIKASCDAIRAASRGVGRDRSNRRLPHEKVSWTSTA